MTDRLPVYTSTFCTNSASSLCWWPGGLPLPDCRWSELLVCSNRAIQLHWLHNDAAARLHEPTQQKYTSRAAMTTPLTIPGLTASLRSDLLGLPIKARSFSSSAHRGFLSRTCHRGREQEEAKESTCLGQRLRLGLQNQPLHCFSHFLPPHPRARTPWPLRFQHFPLSSQVDFFFAPSKNKIKLLKINYLGF